MVDKELVDAIEQIVITGVTMTNASLSRSRQGPELTFPQWRVLVVLGSRPDGLPVHEISRIVEVTLPATGRQLRRLQQRGFLTLEPDRLDRRVTRARLTEPGAAVRDSIMASRRSMIADAIANTPVDRTTVRAISTIAKTLDPRDDPPPRRRERPTAAGVVGDPTSGA